MEVRASRIPSWVGAQALTVSPSLILIVPERVNDQALIAHEETHCKQQAEFGWLKWWAKYLLSREFRLEMELEAYVVQIQHGASLSGCAHNLSTGYWLGISFEQAANLLTQ